MYTLQLRNKGRFAMALLLAGLLGPKVVAQVVINEAGSKNIRTVSDGERWPDWVELLNSGTTNVELQGLYLSDDAQELDKWALPSITLPPGGFLLLFAGDDNSDGLHFSFNLAQEGEPVLLSDANGNVISQLNLPTLRADHSFGLSWDGVGTGSYFTQPTPGMANTTTAYLGYVPPPQFDHAAGKYGGTVHVTIASSPDATTFSTTDGSYPDEGSNASAPTVELSATTTLKARSYKSGWIPSAISSATYFINEQTDLPIVSLSTHPDSLFHEELGLYVPGPNADPEYPYVGANFWSERGVAVHFEFFDEEGVRKVEQEVELRIHGGRASRTKAQRPLRLTARDAYGDDMIRYPFFPERPDVDAFKRIILRNSGADWCLAHYRDGLFHQIAFHNDLDIDELGFRPSIVYINGEYWGIMNIRERIDVDHLATDYGADPDDVLLMEEENLSIQGDTTLFRDLREFILNNDLTDASNWSHVDSLLDISSFTDYFALEMFAGNADWPSNNLKYWKPTPTEGKWRYLLYDLDATMNVVGWIPMDFDMFHWVLVHRAGFVHSEIFRSLMTNPEFKRGFLNRMADLMNTCLSPGAFRVEADRLRNLIAPEIQRHFDRWDQWTGLWYEHADTLIPRFAAERAGHMRDDVLEWYDLPNTATLDIDVYPPAAGQIRLNTIIPDLPFTGIYYNGNDIDLTAIGAEGFRFDHWEFDAETETLGSTAHVRRSFVNSGRVTAVFQLEGAELSLFPNPWSSELQLAVTAEVNSTVRVDVADATGRVVHSQTEILKPGVNALGIRRPDLTPGVYVVTVANGTMRLSGRALKTPYQAY